MPQQALTPIAGAVRSARARCGDCRDYGLVMHRYGDVLVRLKPDPR